RQEGVGRAEEEALEAARHMAAILDRPHPLLTEPACPREQAFMADIARLDRQLAKRLGSLRIERHRGVAALVCVRSNHDHSSRPFVWMSPAKRIAGGHASVRAGAKLLSGHAGDPRAAV